MVRIPTYENYEVLPDRQVAYSNLSANPEAFGTGVSAALSDFGAEIKKSSISINEIVQEQRKKDRETKVMSDFSTKVAPAFRQLSEEFKSNTRGRNTLESYDTYKERANDLVNELLAQETNPHALEQLRPLVQSRLNTTLAGMSSYYLNQQEVVQKETHQSTLSIFDNDIKENFNNPEIFQNRLVAGAVEIERQASEMGWSDNKISSEVNNWKLKQYTNVSHLKINQDPYGAKEWMDNQSDMPESVRSAMTEKLRPALRGMDAERQVENLFDVKDNQTPTIKYNTDGTGFGGGFTGNLKKKFDAVPPQFDALYKKYADLNGIPYMLLRSMSFQESAYDPRAKSSAGAMGLMQLMPATAAELGLTGEAVYDPEKNIAAGARYIKKQIDRFGGNLHLGLAAYNAGAGNILGYTKKNGRKIEGALAKAKRKYGKNPTEEQILEMLPMPEQTVPYVRNILGNTEAVLPPPPIFSKTPPDSTKSIAKLKADEIEIKEEISANLRSGVIDFESAEMQKKILKIRIADQIELLVAQSVEAGKTISLYLRENPQLTEVDIETDPVLSVNFPLLSETAQKNVFKEFGAKQKALSAANIFLDEPRADRDFESVTGGKPIQEMTAPEILQNIKKTEALRTQRNKINYKDTLAEIREASLYGGEDNLVRNIINRPYFENFNTDQSEALLVQASNAESKKATNRLEHFKELARITGQPDLLPKLDGWYLLKADQKTQVLDISRVSKGQGRMNSLTEIQDLIYTTDIDHHLLRQLPIFQNTPREVQEQALEYIGKRQELIDKEAWELAYRITNGRGDYNTDDMKRFRYLTQRSNLTSDENLKRMADTYRLTGKLGNAPTASQPEIERINAYVNEKKSSMWFWQRWSID